jgi:hypothetical protein
MGVQEIMTPTWPQKLGIPCGWISIVTRYVWPFVYGYIKPDEMYHVRCLLVHWRLYLIIVKERWKERLPEVTTKNIFSFVGSWHDHEFLWTTVRTSRNTIPRIFCVYYVFFRNVQDVMLFFQFCLVLLYFFWERTLRVSSNLSTHYNYLYTTFNTYNVYTWGTVEMSIWFIPNYWLD